MEYRLCDNCKKVVEVQREVTYNGGSSVTTTTCPKCGHRKVETKSYIHYGNDHIN